VEARRRLQLNPSRDRLLAARMRAQRLDGRARDPAELVRALGGVQAQEPNAAALSVRARTAGLDRAALDRALGEERSVVRTWAMRGTIHLVASDDARWLHDLLAPLAMPGQMRALDVLGVPDADRPRAVQTIRAALADGPLTRAKLCERLERAGIDTAGQKAAHLPRLAALQGHVCFGPRRGAKDTYVLTDDWLPATRRVLERDAALAELARRYVGAYGPADVRDLAAWSGLPVRDARRAFEAIGDELRETGGDLAILTRDAQRLLDASPPDPPLVRLLPAFDTYLLGYRDRSLAVPDEHARQVWPGGGIIRPTVVANGRAVGAWRLKRGGTRVRVEIEPFDAAAAPDASAEVDDVRRFLGDG
jgi:uncharacterized protein YcaQ